jgi:hypothetical protein
MLLHTPTYSRHRYLEEKNKNPGLFPATVTVSREFSAIVQGIRNRTGVVSHPDHYLNLFTRTKGTLK